MNCDICLVERAELWGFSVAGFYEPLMQVFNATGEWGVCDDCMRLIEAKDARGIAARVTADNARVSALLEPFYVLLLRNITGPPVRFRDQESPLYGGSPVEL